jgi:CRISPR-associated protein Cas1
VTDRILELAERPARLSLDQECLRVEAQGFQPQRIPLEDLGLLVISHPQVQVSAAALQRLSSAGSAVLLCDEKHMPSAMLMPLQSHHLQAEKMAIHASAPLPLRKRLWQQVVRAKIHAQSQLLLRLYGKDGGIGTFVAKVRSGDPDNLESQAARHYWPLLFQDAKFRRNREAPDQNRLLNYGYAVLRAQVARALCASGLHPALGIQHHNRYDSFPLANDFMEPYRPYVDEVVVALWRNVPDTEKLDQVTRAELLSVLHQRVIQEGEERRLSDAILHGAQSFAACLSGSSHRLVFPDV